MMKIVALVTLPGSLCLMKREEPKKELGEYKGVKGG